MSPNFDEIAGDEITGAERDRLRQAHELLVLAGPPPELTPRLGRAPDTAGGSNLFSLPRLPARRPVTLLFAAALLVLAVFFGGYAVGDHRSAVSEPLHTYVLRGTPAAPNAQASLALLPATQGNWPMRLSVSGLAPSTNGSYYEVYLVRKGKPWGSCGSFVVGSSTRPVTVPLNAPYRLRPGDTWIVTREGPGKGRSTTVLEPTVRL